MPIDPSGPPAPAAPPASSSCATGAEESPGPPAPGGDVGATASGGGLAPTMAAPSSASDAAAFAMAGGTGGAGLEKAPGQPEMAAQGQRAGPGLNKPVRSVTRPSEAPASTGDGHPDGMAIEKARSISGPSGARPALVNGAIGELPPQSFTRPTAAGAVTRTAGRGTAAAPATQSTSSTLTTAPTLAPYTYSRRRTALSVPLAMHRMTMPPP